ncbi:MULTISPECIES: FecCD family ABC transporter permease [Nocardioides]|uniref:FecCD family ABC transporter permease n=1 Tax=Nocardioides TaxID=1839 RepID=UPI000330B8F0|nr:MULTISPECIES: iron ABC transporter permease [Nocardioides]EON24559.1 transport system permease [Nocardioides sp. CF8]
MTSLVPTRSSTLPLVITTVVATLLLAVGILLSLGTGEIGLSPVEVLRTLAGQGDPFTELVVRDFRGPRVAAAVLVGASLACSGTILQSVARNPLASPDLLGINAGASVAAVAVVILAGGNGGVSGLAASVGLPIAALLGAMVSGLALYLLAIRNRQLDPIRMVVVGVGIAAAGTSLVSWLLTLGDVMVVGPALAWLSGSLHAVTWPAVAGVGLTIAVVLPFLLAWTRRLDVLVLGDDAAGGLGIDVHRTRVLLLLLATALAGVATSAAGAVVFLALCAPQLARALSRTSRPPLLASAVVGAALLTWADLAARMLLSWVGFGPVELPVGVFTAVLGAPYLLFVVSRTRSTSLEGRRP